MPDNRELREILGLLPFLASYFRQPQAEMPEAMREVFVRNGLTNRHGAVTTQLATGPALSVSELAGRLGVSLPTASELVGDLHRAGLVERNEDPANRRRTLVSLTDSYRPLIEEFVTERAAPLFRAMDGLSAQQRDGFVAGLTAWAREARDRYPGRSASGG